MSTLSINPQLTMHSAALGIRPVKASATKWLASLVDVLRYRRADTLSDIKVRGTKRPQPVEICIAGASITEPSGKWLMYLLRRLSPMERELAVDRLRKQPIERIGSRVKLTSEARKSMVISATLPLAVAPTEALLEEWIAAIIQVLPTATREAVFRAVDLVEHQTPGHHVLYAEMPKILGGTA